MRFGGVAVWLAVGGLALAQERATDAPPALPDGENGPSPGMRDNNGERPPGPPPGGGRKAYTLSGVLTVKVGAPKTETRKTYQSEKQDVSAIFVTDGGVLSLVEPTIITTGNTSSQENSSFYGLNAAVLAAKGGSITIEGGEIRTSGTGANGAFATGKGSSVLLAKTKITATGGGGHGVMASAGGKLTLVDVDIFTADRNAAALATDRGGGTVTVSGGKIVCEGLDSPGIYSTGRIVVSGADIVATGAEAAVIEGANSIELRGTRLVGSKKCGAMIYQSFSGDAEGRRGTFTMSGGSLSVASGPVFYVNNTTGIVNLTGVKIEATSGVFIEAKAGRWGHKGSNGGHAQITAVGQELPGDLVCDGISSISLELRERSKLKGKIEVAALGLDANSTWEVTADSTLTTFTPLAGNGEAAIANIVGNGHRVFYDSKLSGNAWLKGKVFTLNGGGQLLPK